MGFQWKRSDSRWITPSFVRDSSDKPPRMVGSAQHQQLEGSKGKKEIQPWTGGSFAEWTTFTGARMALPVS